MQTHIAGFTSAMGKTPAIIGGAICANQPGTFSCTPDTWPGTVSGQGSLLSFLPAGQPLMVTWSWQNNSGTSLYNDMALVTNTMYAGHPIAYWVQQTLAAWLALGYKTLYVRPNWEWNGNPAWAQTPCAAGVSTATFVTALRNFTATCNAFAAANGMTIFVCWNPSVYGQTDACGDTLASQFPGNTGCHVVCADFYAESGELASGPAGGSTTWSVRNLVSLAQGAGLPIGFCELGGLLFGNPSGPPASNTFIPDVASYVKSIRPTACAFMMLWDVNTGLDETGNLEWTAPDAGQPNIISAWKAALGPGGSLE